MRKESRKIFADEMMIVFAKQNEQVVFLIFMFKEAVDFMRAVCIYGFSALNTILFWQVSCSTQRLVIEAVGLLRIFRRTICPHCGFRNLM